MLLLLRSPVVMNMYEEVKSTKSEWPVGEKKKVKWVVLQWCSTCLCVWPNSKLNYYKVKQLNHTYFFLLAVVK